MKTAAKFRSSTFGRRIDCKLVKKRAMATHFRWYLTFNPRLWWWTYLKTSASGGFGERRYLV
jgi:hypothetical protein